MNKAYRSVWSETTGTWVAAAETATGRKKKDRSSRVVGVGLVGVVGSLALASGAYAGEIINCSPTGSAWESDFGNAGNNSGAWGQGTGYGACLNGGSNSGVVISEQQGNALFSGTSNAGIYVGKTDYSGAGTVTLWGPSGINLDGATTTTGLATFQAGATMSNTKITALAAGTVSSSSTDAVNGSQLYATNQSISNVAGDVTAIT